jgi:hypothetical protein
VNMPRIVRTMTNAFHAIVDALRRNNRLPHALFLGVAAAILFGSAMWLALSLGLDALAYIDQHGWEKTMERLDSFTGRIWNRSEK